MKDAKGHGSEKRGGVVREQARAAINRALALAPPKATAAAKVAEARAALKAALAIAPRPVVAPHAGAKSVGTHRGPNDARGHGRG